MNLKFHESIQGYFSACYKSLATEIKASMLAAEDQIYGELYYYSVVKLLKHINLVKDDHFLDVGSGLGKLVLQIFLTTPASIVTGVEINNQRHLVATAITNIMHNDLPELFAGDRKLRLLNEDFLQTNVNDVTVVYICSTVFSFALLQEISNKINNMPKVRMVISLRKLPNLQYFQLKKKIFLHGCWDYTAGYIYLHPNKD